MNHNGNNKGEILIIDDEEDFIQVITIMLELEGYTVASANDGVQGIETFIRQQQSINFVICDLNLPHLDGNATLQAILKIKPTVKCILMSGSVDEESLPNLVNHPSCTYLQKPFSVQILVENVEKAMKDRIS